MEGVKLLSRNSRRSETQAEKRMYGSIDYVTKHEEEKE